MNELEKYRDLTFTQIRNSGLVQEKSRVKCYSMGEAIWEDYTYINIGGESIEFFSYDDYIVFDKYPIEIIKKEKLDKIKKYLKDNPIGYKEKLIEEVLTQLDSDLEFGDRTAIEELLSKVDIKYLEAYLSEDSLNPDIPNG